MFGKNVTNAEHTPALNFVWVKAMTTLGGRSANGRRSEEGEGEEWGAREEWGERVVGQHPSLAFICFFGI